MALTKIGATLGGSADVITVTQNSHTLTLGYPVKMTSSGYAHATADSAANAEVVGIIIATTTNTVTIALGGRITVDGCVPNVTAGTVLFLQVSAGLLAATEPSSAGQISKPMAVVTVANSEMIMVQQRGEVLSTGAAAIADGSITLAKMAVNSIDSDQYVDGSIDLVHMSANSIDSDQYVNGSIDTVHIGDNQVTLAKLDNTARETNIQLVVVDFATALTTGDGKFYFYVPATLNGFNIVAVHAEVITAPAGSVATFMLHNVTSGADILSPAITIDAGETGSDTAATAAVINTSEDDLTTHDIIRVDIDGVGSGTAGSGLIINMTCRLP